jgi:diguanylate cyclase (GGDEF)-like protein
MSNHKTDMSEVLSVVMLDVDRFKQINDTYGHLIGDQVLIEVAKVLKHSVRENDLVIRYGGDEFILILEKTTEASSQIIMERIKKELSNMSKFEFSVDISYGIIEMNEKPNIFDAIALADEKMYEMKKMR